MMMVSQTLKWFLLFIYTDGVSGCACAHLLQELAVKVTALDQELSTVRKDVALLFSELGQIKHILNGISKELTEWTKFDHDSSV